MGGSYHIEQLTDSIESAAAAMIERIDTLGGALAAIESGFIEGRIRESAYQFQQAVESGQQVVVGVNRFRVQEESRIPTFHADPSIEALQVDRLRQLRASRDAGVLSKKLDRVEAAARASDNLMPYILDAAQARATVGEISDRLRRVFGEYQ